MIILRRSSDRGHFNHGWLKTYHTFSFSEYYDPEWMGFRTLRVINEDWVAPSEGFPTHAHRDMEIVTYVLEGALEHKDSMKNGSIIVPGEVQRMSAGKGVTHSEYNQSKTDPVHLLQIWIMTEKRGIEPGYEQTCFSDEEKSNKLRLIASPHGADGSVTIHQQTDIYASILEEGKSVTHDFRRGGYGWVQVISGSVEVNGIIAEAGDGLALNEEKIATLKGLKKSELLLFDLP